jgi:hypothetical protein
MTRTGSESLASIGARHQMLSRLRGASQHPNFSLRTITHNEPV